VLFGRTSLGGSIAWYLNEKYGGIELILDRGCRMLDQVIYDRFGQVTETTPPNGDRFKYASIE
jgi:hypothetical protein